MRPPFDDLADPDRLADLVDALHEVGTHNRERAERCAAVADEVTLLAWATAVDRTRTEEAAATLGRAALAAEQTWVLAVFLRRTWPWRRRVRYALALLSPWWPRLR